MLYLMTHYQLLMKTHAEGAVIIKQLFVKPIWLLLSDAIQIYTIYLYITVYSGFNIQYWISWRRNNIIK